MQHTHPTPVRNLKPVQAELVMGGLLALMVAEPTEVTASNPL